MVKKSSKESRERYAGDEGGEHRNIPGSDLEKNVVETRLVVGSSYGNETLDYSTQGYLMKMMGYDGSKSGKVYDRRRGGFLLFAGSVGLFASVVMSSLSITGFSILEVTDARFSLVNLIVFALSLLVTLFGIRKRASSK